MNDKLAEHPNLVSWAVLAAGMLVVLTISARDQGLNPGQWFWLAVATVLLAGLCAWIIGWEAEDETEDERMAGSSAAPGSDAALEADAAPAAAESAALTESASTGATSRPEGGRS